VLFDYLLIFGKFGFPELGFNGAAIASIISEFMGMFVIFIVIHKKGIGKRFSLFKDFRWDNTNLRLILTLSSPIIFQYAISIASWEYFFLLIDGYGETALAISNTMRNVFGLFGVVTWAFAATTNAMVSNVIGQGLQDRVWELMGKIIRLSTGWAIFVALIINIFPGLYLSIFGQSGEFKEQAIPVIRVVTGAMFLMSFSTVFLNAVTGSGNTRVSLFIEAYTIILYCIYIYLVLDKYRLSITIGWMAEWLYWICMFIPSLLYIRSGRWKNKVI
jgi:Na+-driven multidrug efflux pump